MNLHVLPETNADVGEALTWLVRRGWHRKAGDLWSEWQDGLAAITAMPHQFPPAEDAPTGREVRLYPTRRFKYLIAYEVTTGEIKVFAFVRANRLSGVWLRRLGP